MLTTKLNEVFEGTLESMIKSIESGTDINYEGDEFSFWYEEDGFMIEGGGTVGGNWSYGGDGYYSPYEASLNNGWGTLDQLEISHTDDKTGEYTEFTESEIKEFKARLEKELTNYMKSY